MRLSELMSTFAIQKYDNERKEEYLRIISVFAEFARTRSASKMIDRVRQKGEILLKHPYSGPLEPLLSDRKRDYRCLVSDLFFIFKT